MGCPAARLGSSTTRRAGWWSRGASVFPREVRSSSLRTIRDSPTRVAALASLATWSRSVELLARLARDTLVVPAAVRGVVSRSAFDHPLAKRCGVLKERQRMATLLQLALPLYRANRVSIRFGSP